MEFVIPSSREELRKDEGKHTYVVKQKFDTDELAVVLDECSTTFDSDGPRAILDCFDVYYSFVSHYNEVNNSVKTVGWNSCVNVLEGLSQGIDKWLDKPVMEDKHVMRNSVKMTLYIVVQLMEVISNEEAKPSINVATKGRKSTKKSTSSDGKLDWSCERERTMRVIAQLLELDMKQLWEPPLPSSMDELSNVIVGCCFKLLEDRSAARDKSLRELLVQVLGHLVRSYNQTLGVVLKAVQMLQHFEHLMSPLAQIIQSISVQFNYPNIVTEIVRELANRDPADLSMDTSGTRSFCGFLVELGQRVPAAILPVMEPLLVHLGGESYVMRNAVLSIVGELLVQELSSEASDGSVKKTRDQYLHLLEGHIHDTNAFVRSKVLQIWRQLSEAKVIPISLQCQLLELVRGRLSDRSSSVRKSAIVLLTSFLNDNPYVIAQLDEEQLSSQLTAAQDKLKELQKQIPSEDKAPSESGPDEQLTQQVAQNMLAIRYFTDALAFTTSMCACIPVVTQLLGSKISTDIIESLQFLASAFEFKLKGAAEGVRKSLVLVWSGETQIREALVAMYQRLYLGDDSVDGLLSVVQGRTVGDYASLEQLVMLLSKIGHITPSLLNQLWDVFAMKERSSGSEHKSCQALLALAMACDQDMIQAHLSLLISIGMGPRAQHDPLLALYTCHALQRLITKSSDKQHLRLPSSHVIFTRLTELLVSGLIDISLSHWQPLAEQAVFTIYGLAEQPDVVCEQLLRQLVAAGGLDVCSTQPIATSTQDTEGVELEDAERQLEVQSLVLARLLGCVGDIAQRQLVHLEVTISRELKRRRLEQEDASPRKKASHRKQPSEITITEEEMLLTGASADDPEAELVRRLCEVELLEDTSLFGQFVPIILEVCLSPSQYSCPTLQTAAALSLAKLMLISSTFCEQQLQLLVTILEKSSLSVIRANTIVCLADLMVHFPNLVEPWTAHLYNRLHDESGMVRKSTLVSLTHLILNDMIKVKGQISEIALCMEDTNSSIADLAKLFFHELAKKGNSLYNLLPDIIGRLSDPECSISSITFQSISKYLFTFIKKDRQSESLVEKLCHRFRTTRLEKQWGNIAFCLAQLSYSERGLHKLQDNLSCYQDKLHDDEVYNNLTAIATRTKKFAKPEVKNLLEELEQQWKKLHNKGSLDDDPTSPVKPEAVPVAGSTVKRSVARRKGKKQPLREANISSDEELSPVKKHNTQHKNNSTVLCEEQ